MCEVWYPRPMEANRDGNIVNIETNMIQHGRFDASR
jgi:hypothetical protein